jgi:hypothetical protein
LTPAPQHGEPAGDAFLAIQSLARRTNADVQELLTLYALEGLIARIAASRHRNEFVLKGGVLLAAFNLRRPTKDIDLQATGLPNDVDEVLARVRELASIDAGDGLIFDPGQTRAHIIREDEGYPGVRVRLVATLGKARLTVGIDVNFGDPIWPAPSEIVLPRLVQLGQDPVRLLGHPLPMVVAEKIVTALDRGEANTRWRDYADILRISGVHELPAGDLRAAFEAVADFRGVDLRALLPALATMPSVAQPKWARWRRRQSHADHLPGRFEDVLNLVAAFVDPILRDELPAAAQWNSTDRTWMQRPGSAA